MGRTTGTKGNDVIRDVVKLSQPLQDQAGGHSDQLGDQMQLRSPDLQLDDVGAHLAHLDPGVWRGTQLGNAALLPATPEVGRSNKVDEHWGEHPDRDNAREDKMSMEVKWCPGKHPFGDDECEVWWLLSEHRRDEVFCETIDGVSVAVDDFQRGKDGYEIVVEFGGKLDLVCPYHLGERLMVDDPGIRVDETMFGGDQS